MKRLEKSLFFLVVLTMFWSIVFALSSCEEYIIENTIDTVYIERPVNTLVQTYITLRDTTVIRDTVEVKVVVRDTIIQNTHTTDTVFQVVTKDSVIIREVEKIIYHTDTVKVTIVETDTIINEIEVVRIDTVIMNVIQHDTVTVTVYDRTVVYRDTFWVIDPFNMVTFIPNEVLPYVTEFSQSCWDRGLQVNSMPLLVQYSNNLPGDGWSSFSYIVGFQQMIIEISDKLPAEQQRAGILREMNRLQRNKKYTAIPDRIMNPLFPPDQTITASHLNELYK